MKHIAVCVPLNDVFMGTGTNLTARPPVTATYYSVLLDWKKLCQSSGIPLYVKQSLVDADKFISDRPDIECYHITYIKL